MPLTRTLAQIRDSVQRTAGISAFVGAGKRHTTESVNDLINRGFGALTRATAVVDPEFRPIASTEIETDGDATSYALPSNCRSVLAVYYEADGVSTWLIPYELHERAMLSSAQTTAQSSRASHYKVLGTNIDLLPLADDGHTATVWYATTSIQLTADGQSADVYDRLDDFVIWWAAREICKDREDWERHDRLTADLEGLRGEIAILARSRDLSHPGRIVDVREANRYGRVRYR
jgi:hypothetical protein